MKYFKFILGLIGVLLIISAIGILNVMANLLIYFVMGALVFMISFKGYYSIKTYFNKKIIIKNKRRDINV